MRTAWVCAAAFALLSCAPEPQPPAPVPSVQFDRTSADLVEHGRRVASVLGCNGCHGADLQGLDWGDPEFGVLWTSNLTQALPGYTDVQLEATIRSGRRPDDSELWGMPSHIFTQLAPDDMAAVVAFLRSVPAAGPVHPRPSFAAGGRAEVEAGTLVSSATEVARSAAAQPPHLGDDVALGRYLVRSTCAECHNLDLRGGTPYPGAEPRPDLRMVTAYDAAQFERLLKTGTAIGDRELGLMGEVARGRFTYFTDRERLAVHQYLQRLGATPDP
jgi:mono/diheme cytochrome c family protein